MIKKDCTTKSIDVLCDECGAMIAHYREDGVDRRMCFNIYFHVVTGNNSPESIEEYIFCPKCIDKAYEDYKKLCLGRYNTRYIEFEHVHTLSNKGEEK